MQVDKVVGLDVIVQEPAYGCKFISSKVAPVPHVLFNSLCCSALHLHSATVCGWLSLCRDVTCVWLAVTVCGSHCVIGSHFVCGSQVSGFNIGIEQEGPEGAEYINLPVPDQFETCMSVDADGVHSLSTDTVDHASA